MFVRLLAENLEPLLFFSFNLYYCAISHIVNHAITSVACAYASTIAPTLITTSLTILQHASTLQFFAFDSTQGKMI